MQNAHTQTTEVFQMLRVLVSFPGLDQGQFSANEAEAAVELLPPGSRTSDARCFHLPLQYSTVHPRSAFPILSVRAHRCEPSYLIPWGWIPTLLLRPVQGGGRWLFSKQTPELFSVWCNYLAMATLGFTQCSDGTALFLIHCSFP